MLGKGCALDVFVAQHTVVSCELYWLYHRLVHVLDQGVNSDVLVLPAEDVHGVLILLFIVSNGESLFLY